MSFITSTETRYGKGVGRALSALMRAMSLPDASEDECTIGTEANLLFLNKYGIVIRAGQPLRCPEHGLILKPLGAQTGFEERNRNVIEIVPGVEGVIDRWDDQVFLGETLLAEGIDYRDAQMANSGYIKVDIPGFPRGVPVVIDRGAVNDARFSNNWRDFQNKSCNGLSDSFDRAALNGFQGRHFGHLQSLLSQSWVSPHEVNKDAMVVFLEACVKAKREGVLSSRWCSLDGGDDYKSLGVVRKAADYARRMAGDDAIARSRSQPRTFSPL